MATKSRHGGRAVPVRWGVLAVLVIVLIVAWGLQWFVPRSPLPRAHDVGSFGPPPPDQRVHEPILPIRPATGLDPRKVALGRRLFHDKRLSGDNSIACVTCHDLSRGGTDHLVVSKGVRGVEGDVNTITVFNSSLNFRYLWDGRARTLEQLMDIVVTSPKMLASRWPDVLDKLEDVPAYVAAFDRIYPGGVSKSSIIDTLVAFDRSLVTPGSRFDRYLLGDRSAITPAERHGYELFKSYGCISCHQGRNVGGNMFQVFGVMEDYFADRGNVTKADLGRFNVTGNEADRYKFRVPSLRNVAVTAPYFHDGTAATLDAAVDDMAKYQLGRPMPAADQRDIVRFLKTLTGKYRGRPL